MVGVMWGNFMVDGLMHFAPWDKHGRIQDGHVESMNCWCAPDLQTYCTQCKGDGCWKCDGSGFATGSILDPPRVRYVIHRDMSHDDDT